MRTLRQPGPVHPKRIDSIGGDARKVVFTVKAGVTLLDGVTGPLAASGFGAACVRFAEARVDPFRYVRPARAADASHVAYFSSVFAPAGTTRIEQARGTFGWNGGAPFLHCHAAWIEPGGQRRGGHILNGETTLVAPVEVEAWGFDHPRIDTAKDPETNFTLLQPSGPAKTGGNAILARIRPNEDIVSAIEAVAASHGVRDALVAGSVGSLVGTRFTDGREVFDDATEVLITHGHVDGGEAMIDAISVDMSGFVHEGRLMRGGNAVCITFDLVLIQPG